VVSGGRGRWPPFAAPAVLRKPWQAVVRRPAETTTGAAIGRARDEKDEPPKFSAAAG
jgi:hypothetical protein